MRKLCIPLAVMAILGSSCKKNDSVQNELRDDNLAVNNVMGFNPINDISGSYISETSLLSIAGITGGDAPSSLTDGNLTATLTGEFYKVDPSPFNWDGSWGVSPNVESPDPHALYNPAFVASSIQLSKPVRTFGMELFWDGTIPFKVEFYNGTTLVGDVTRTFTPSSPTSMGSAYLFAATYSNGTFNKIVFTPMGSTAFGFAIAQLRYAEPLKKMVHFDVYPGSCINQFNTKSMGVMPVIIAGKADFNVNDIDLSTIRINGVAPKQKAFEKIAAAFTKTSDCDCSPSGSDNYTDLSLKFEKPEITATLGNVMDGAQVALTIKGKLKNGIDFEGKDCVRIKK